MADKKHRAAGGFNRATSCVQADGRSGCAVCLTAPSSLLPWQEKRSAYAPSEETPVRYDGIYRIVKCWRKPGEQGFLICRYLFVRADNEPAPWSSDGASCWLAMCMGGYRATLPVAPFSVSSCSLSDGVPAGCLLQSTATGRGSSCHTRRWRR